MKKRFHFYIVGGVLLIGLILGSFFDLQINAAIFNRDSIFGLGVSAFGMIPGYGALAFLGGALFAMTFKDQRFPKWAKAIFIAVSAALVVVATIFLGRDVFAVNGFYKLENLYWLGFVIMGIFSAAIAVGGYFVAKGNTNPNMWIATLILAFAIFMALVPGVTLFKAIMHRPRYRIGVYENLVTFHNWWEPCKDYKEVIAGFPNVLSKEEFKSFPSGHAGATMCSMILLSYIPVFNKKYEKYQVLFFYIGFAWSLVVMFARMLVGAHYLSDVCVGAILTLVFFYIANEIIVRKILDKEEKAEEKPEEKAEEAK